ncbi:MAG TPA: hypothetical protein VHD56_07425 [Tepidisphaeraceae bacterium]|nr:hypothetical protein [Tepidisphaeraceae bacterium]
MPNDDACLEALPDQVEYVETARNLLAGQGMQFFDRRFGESVYAYRMPAYPLLIALCGGDVRIVRIAQALIDTSTVLAIYLLARRWIETGPALFAAAIVAINPFLIYFSGLLLSETLFTAMLAWGMCLLVGRRWWSGALLLALSVLVRPSALALPMVLGLGADFVRRKRPVVGIATLAMTILVLIPWAYRNHLAVNQWVWGTTNGGISLYDGMNPSATGASDQRFVANMPQLRTLSEVERSRYFSHQAWAYAADHPAAVLKLAAIKIGRTLSPIPLSAEYGSNRRLVAVALAYMVPLDLLAIVGLWRARRSAKMYLLLPVLYFTAVHAVFIGSLRYRVPADVPIAILAALGVARTREALITDSERPINGPPL